MDSSVRAYLRDFAREFDRNTGIGLHGTQSVQEFYSKWELFIQSVTSVSLRDPHPMDIYSIANTCALRSKNFVQIG